MKKFVYTLLFLSVFMCFGFVNISPKQNQISNNAFRIVRQASDSGQIVLSYVFPLNSEKMKEVGVEEKDILVYKFYLTTYVNSLVQNSKSRQGKGVVVSNCLYFESVDGVGYSIAFENIDAQKRYFGTSDEQEKSNAIKTKSKGFFMKTTYLQTTFPISSQAVADNLKAVCKYALSSWCKNEEVSQGIKEKLELLLDESIFVYDFATQQSSLQSDVMYQDEIFSHNVFVKTYAELAEDNKITFWVTAPNKPVWYFAALVVVVLSIAIAFLIVKVKKNHKKF